MALWRQVARGGGRASSCAFHSSPGAAVVRRRGKPGTRRRLSSTTDGAGGGAAAEAAPVEAAPTRNQLLKLCMVSSVPFIGFGIADNAIMILAGDAIDETFGAALGISTLAAAGLGNLCSDVVGIGAGDAIERACHRLGLREPPLTVVQNAMDVTRRTRTIASVLGISIGCIIGMAPLLFLRDRKKLYFNEKELSLYETVFQPFGVTSPDFFELMQHSKWKTAEKGTVIVQSGQQFDKVIMVHNGSAEAYGLREAGGLGPGASVAGRPEMLYRYRGRAGKDCLVIGASVAGDQGEGGEASAVGGASGAPSEDDTNIRGSIIGGTALVDTEASKFPYPNTVIATGHCDYVEWTIAELREQMSQNKAVEAAVFSTLYLDLVEGLKRQRMETVQRLGSVDREIKETAMNEFAILMKAVCSDGRIHPSERQMVREFMAENDISPTDMIAQLQALGWSGKEWELGVKTEIEYSDLQKRIQTIPGMLKNAGIRSRVTAGLHIPTKPASGGSDESDKAPELKK